MRSYGSSASGLQCSWGSDMDSKIPRPKLPKQALPDSLRASLGFTAPRAPSKRFGDSDQSVRSEAVAYTRGGMEAKEFLKMKSGVPMSLRTSGLVQLRNSSLGFQGHGHGSNSSSSSRNSVNIMKNKEEMKDKARQYEAMQLERKRNQAREESYAAYSGQSQNQHPNKKESGRRDSMNKDDRQRRKSGALQTKEMGFGENVDYQSMERGTREKFVSKGDGRF